MTLYRWTFTWALTFLFIADIAFQQAYYIVTYALGIYLLSECGLFTCCPLDSLQVHYADELSHTLKDLFLAFLQPKFDPSIEQDLAEQDVEEGAPGLPTSASPKANGHEDDEFRPFIRRLPEFQFWLSATKAILFGLVATLFP